METTLKGPYLLGASLVVMLLGNFRFVPSSHTRSPGLYGLYRGFSFIQDSCALRWASWAAVLASLICSSRFVMLGMLVLLIG